MHIIDFLRMNGYTDFEGGSDELEIQQNDLKTLVSRPNVKRILEIGFNTGFSTEIFLSTNPECTVVSFDLCEWDYVKKAKNYIDYKFPHRHTMIFGDSTETVAKYANDNPNNKFDLIFIDGGHKYEIAKADMLNCHKLADTHTILVVDDTMFVPEGMAPWMEGPTKVWKESVESGLITTEESRNYKWGKGMSWGKYKVDHSPKKIVG
jgi:predicted O-methyltransferase YrrM